VLKVSLANAYPRCYATRRISARTVFISGRSLHDARRMRLPPAFSIYFKIRRCQIKIRRDPALTPAACIRK
jgi:hypothetical protein